MEYFRKGNKIFGNMTQARVRMAHLDEDVSICDPEIPENSGTPSLIEKEANMSTSGNTSSKQKTKEKSRGRNSRTNKNAEMELLEDKMEERLRKNIEARFTSFEDKICGILSSKLRQASVSATVTSNTSGGCNSPVRPRANSITNNCTSVRVRWQRKRRILDID